MTSENAERINQTANSFYEKLPENDTERTAVAADVATTVCSNGSGSINTSVFGVAGETKRQSYRVYHAAETMNQYYTNDIRPQRVQKVIDTSENVARYTTVVGTYNEFYEASCAFDSNDPESVKRFYITGAALGVEIAMMQYGVYYKASSKLTRMASHTKTFRAVQSHFGDDALRMLMSESYWAINGGLHGASDFIRHKSTEMDLEMNDTSAYRSSIEDRIDDAEDAEVSEESLREKWEEAGAEEKASCLEEALGGLQSAEKLTQILKDREIEWEEITELEPENRDEFEECLSGS